MRWASLSKSIGSPPPEWNIKPVAGFPMERRYAFRDFRQLANDRDRLDARSRPWRVDNGFP